jgi:CheY-like chemotaxis protein
MLVRLLTSKNHVCEQAEDGEVAVRKYLEMVERGEPPDAILMDFEMPVMNGPSATARLRELGCACLIVGVTGNVLPRDVAFFVAQGADAVLPKPLVSTDLEQILFSRQARGATESGNGREFTEKGAPAALRCSVKEGSQPASLALARKSRGARVAVTTAAP